MANQKLLPQNIQGIRKAFDAVQDYHQSYQIYLVLAVIALALGLRVWGIDFGLPYEITYEQVTYEEAKEVHRAFKLGAGEYYWVFIGKGGLYYLLFVEYAFLYVVWWITGVVKNTHEFALHVLQNRTIFFLAGRLTVALMGALTCLIIYMIGRRVYNGRVGLGAAVIGATAYFHAIFSHFINVDIGMTLALWASVLVYLVYEHKQKYRWLIGAGALGGIAIAFKLPGVSVILILLMAISSASSSWRAPLQRFKEAGIVLVALLVTLTVVAPEWIVGVSGVLPRNFSRMLGQAAITPTTTDPLEDPQDTIRSITTFGVEERLNYVRLLLKEANLVLTLCALLGGVLGVFRRHRWDIIWSVYIVAFVGIMSLADRSQPERYLIPIMPALWLLGSRAVFALSKRHWSLPALGLMCIVAIPLISLVRSNYEMTHPDTRVLAKAWIETNIPSGAKILMDGMRYRFIQSPPLNPDKTTIADQVANASKEQYVGRGVSQLALKLYSEAMGQNKGPTYELYSTGHGFGVKDINYYVQECFDYIITSSYITRRMTIPGYRQHFPENVRFYEQLHTDSRLRFIHNVMPVPWQNSGPTISVYKVLSNCNSSSPRNTNP